MVKLIVFFFVVDRVIQIMSLSTGMLNKLVFCGIIFTTKLLAVEAINVTAWVGRNNFNITLYVVNDSVTWYAASTLCGQEAPGTFDTASATCDDFLFQTIQQENRLSDGLVWIGRFKDVDDKVYKATRCAEIITYSHKLTNLDKNGEIRCVAANASQDATSWFGLDNCYEKHPYGCIKVGKVGTEYISLPIYTNVTVSYLNTDTFTSLMQYKTYDSCDKDCFLQFKCIGYIYDHIEGTCRQYRDKSFVVGKYTEFQVENSTDKNISNVVKFKPGQRLFLEWITPTVSNSNLQAPEKRCYEEETTTPGTITPTTEGCRCYCYYNGTSINTTELARTVAALTSLLTVNKKNLSSHTRQLNCAQDSRTSSRVMGAAGIIVITVVVLLTTYWDILQFIRYLINMIKNYVIKK